jgi:DNA-binding GntR family transcriptional regulator
MMVEVGGVVKQKSGQDVYARLRAMVLSSELMPGANYLEQGLADQLSVSRTPVREALILLQREGLVEVVPRHGVRILPLSAQEMAEIYTVLSALEPEAIRTLAQSEVAQSLLDDLGQATADMQAAFDSGDMAAWAEADERFHLHIIENCGNRRLIDIVRTCWDRVHRARSMTIRLRPPSDPALSIAEHREVIEALRGRDAERGAAVYRQHRERGGRDQVEVIESLGLKQL